LPSQAIFEQGNIRGMEKALTSKPDKLFLAIDQAENMTRLRKTPKLKKQILAPKLQ